MADLTTQFQQQIEIASSENNPLRIQGHNTKAFIGNRSRGELLETSEHSGILMYDASELVMKVRSGTTLAEIEAALDENNQCLPFEPMTFDGEASIGGTIACNISGPARAYKGAARDYLLGASIINGKAEVLEFGGQVMKNVAGYDASRLMAGALGTLGLILDVSLKVLPKNACEKTVAFEQPVNEAIQTINQLSGRNIPINASYYDDGTLYVRISSSKLNAEAASKLIATEHNGRLIDNDAERWKTLREQRHAFFNSDQPIARLSVPATCDTSHINGEQLIEWSGALRWIKSPSSIELLRVQATELGGHASAYKNYPPETEYFQPLDSLNHQLQKNIKQAFDPAGIFNRDRLYTGF